MKRTLEKIDYDYGKAKDVIEQAYLSNEAVVQNALKQESATRTREDQELHGLYEDIIKFQEEIDYEVIFTEIQNQIDLDFKLTEALNEGLKNANGHDKPDFVQNQVTWSLKTNKFKEMLEGAKQLLNMKNLSNILEDRLPEDYSMNIKTAPICGESSNTAIYGNSKATYLKTALFYTKKVASVVTNNTVKLWDAVDQSAIMHLLPLPTKYKPENFSECTFSYNQPYNGDASIEGVVIPHSSYAFGGQRGESRYGAAGKQFGTEDCSSWIAKLFGCENQFSTVHQLYAHRKQSSSLGNVGEEGDSVVDEINSRFNSVKVSDPQKDIKAGMVLVRRKFDMEKDPKQEGNGIGGHTALMLGTADNGQTIYTLGFNRNMPVKEGFGVEEFKYQDEGIKSMIMR
ncbi:MAG: hypothetical protein J0G32_03335 [Alphaproteobacteria bacterium]|nr:hypothetical protein [Alphaproteobacteria bacterium]